MLEDELLKLKFKRGNTEALAAIYDKYADYLLSLATALLNDHALAEDVLHDVFVRFAKSVTSFRIRGSLKAYLAKSVINRSRDHMRKRGRRPVSLDDAQMLESCSAGPDSVILLQEQSLRLTDALGQLPFEQREVVVLKIKAGMKFRQIAALQEISVTTAQARYRYGIDKLRSILNSEKEK
ncbi:MAG: sigma-70 family RNA polymerase sigma factor [Anaerohalosphaera sp.]|nr:sigma-70 family RNA polymerase sigma factor [Anaerohalosphaera sp.]